MSKQSSLFGFMKRKSSTANTDKSIGDPSLKKRKIKPEDEKFKRYENVTLPKGYYAIRNSLITNDLDNILSNDINSKSTKIASFDFDNTLANRSFSRDLVMPRDLTHPTIPYYLLKLHKQGYRIVIFTNEATIGMRKKPETIKSAIDTKLRSLETFVNYMQAITMYDETRKCFVAKKLLNGSSSEKNNNNINNKNNNNTSKKFPIHILIATRKDFYRKPNSRDIMKEKNSGGIGMWNYFTKNASYELSPPSIESSFFVGDAAGRQSDFKQSDGDLKFAERIGLRFFNEVDFWMKNQVSLFSGGKDNNYDDDYNKMVSSNTRQHYKRPDIVWKSRNDTIVKSLIQKKFNDSSSTHNNIPVVLILHGLPGSGKSTFANKLKHWVVICQDELKSRKKCNEKFFASLRQRSNVIIDRTNISKDQRNFWIETASKNNSLCILVDFDSYYPQELIGRCLNRVHVGNLDGHNYSGEQIKNIIRRIENSYEQPNCEQEGLFSIVHCKNDNTANEIAEKFSNGYIPLLTNALIINHNTNNNASSNEVLSSNNNKKKNNIVDDVKEKAMQVHPNVVISSKKVSPQVEEDKNKSEETKLIDRTEAQDNVIIQALQNNNVTPEELFNTIVGRTTEVE